MPTTPKPEIDLPDINVWLALTCEDHEHHARARRYWENEGASQFAFCRITMLGLLRLATNVTVMQNRPFTAPEAWKIYRDFMALPEVMFLGEVLDIEVRFGVHSDAPKFPTHRWTDAYLAAFAQGSGCRLVSFDTGFDRFRELEVLCLRS